MSHRRAGSPFDVRVNFESRNYFSEERILFALEASDFHAIRPSVPLLHLKICLAPAVHTRQKRAGALVTCDVNPAVLPRSVPRGRFCRPQRNVSRLHPFSIESHRFSPSLGRQSCFGEMLGSTAQLRAESQRVGCRVVTGPFPRVSGPTGALLWEGAVWSSPELLFGT